MSKNNRENHPEELSNHFLQVVKKKKNRKRSNIKTKTARPFRIIKYL